MTSLHDPTPRLQTRFSRWQTRFRRQLTGPAGTRLRRSWQQRFRQDSGEHGSLAGAALVALATLTLLYNLDVIVLPGIVSLVFYAAIVAVVVVLWRRHPERVVLPGISSVLLLAIILLSVFWSDLPDYSGERLRTFGPALMAAWLAGAGLTRERFTTTIRLTVGLQLASFVFLIALFPWARLPDGEGPSGWHAQTSKNGLGLLLAFCLIVVLIYEVQLLRLLAIATIVVLAIGNESRTSQLSMLITAGLLLGGAWALRASSELARRHRILILVCGGTGLGLLGLALRDWILGLVGKDPTLSQRTVIWDAAWTQVQQAPLLGHGAFTFLEPDSHSRARQAVALQVQTFIPPHAHNGPLDLVGQIGLVGLIVYLAFLVGFVTLAWRIQDPQLRTFSLLFTVFILLWSSAEPTFLGGWLVATFFVDGHLRNVTQRQRRLTQLDARKDQLARVLGTQDISSHRRPARRTSLPELVPVLQRISDRFGKQAAAAPHTGPAGRVRGPAGPVHRE